MGSLIRPPELQELIRGGKVGAPAYEQCLKESVLDVVRRRLEAGIDIPSDGEFGKNISWSQYALERLSGFERRPVSRDENPFYRGADCGFAQGPFHRRVHPSIMWAKLESLAAGARLARSCTEG